MDHLDNLSPLPPLPPTTAPSHSYSYAHKSRRFPRPIRQYLTGHYDRERPRAFAGDTWARLDRVQVLGDGGGFGHTGCVNALSWSDDGSILLSGSDDKRICIWTPDTTAPITPNMSPHPLRLSDTILTGHRANIFSARFLPNANTPTIVSCAGDHQIRIFEVENLVSADGVATRVNDRSARWGVEGPGVRVLKCHQDRTKRIATDVSPYVFLTVSEDGTVRQHDLRRPHRCPAECPDPLFRAPPGVDLYSLSVSLMAPHLFSVAGQTDCIYVCDRRMPEHQKPGWGPHTRRADQVSCVRRLGLSDDDWGRTANRRRTWEPDRHVTCAKMSPHNPDEVIGAFASHSTALFSINDSPVDKGAAATSAHSHLPPNSKNGRARAGAQTGAGRTREETGPAPAGDTTGSESASTNANRRNRSPRQEATTDPWRAAAQFVATYQDDSNHDLNRANNTTGRTSHGVNNNTGSEGAQPNKRRRSQLSQTTSDSSRPQTRVRTINRDAVDTPEPSAQEEEAGMSVDGVNPQASSEPPYATASGGSGASTLQEDAASSGIEDRPTSPSMGDRLEAGRAVAEDLLAMEDDLSNMGDDPVMEDDSAMEDDPAMEDDLPPTYQSIYNTLPGTINLSDEEISDNDEPIYPDLDDDDGDDGSEIDLGRYRALAQDLERDDDGDSDGDDGYMVDSDEEEFEDDFYLPATPSAEGEFRSVGLVYPRRMFFGARNTETVKDCNFLGDWSNKVASGSDDGNFFVWDKATGRLDGIWRGDGDIVNVMEQHPTLPLISVSGIDSTVKMFAPTASAPSPSYARLNRAEEIIAANRSRRTAYNDRRSMLQFLRTLMAATGGQVRGLVDDNADDEPRAPPPPRISIRMTNMDFDDDDDEEEDGEAGECPTQ